MQAVCISAELCLHYSSMRFFLLHVVCHFNGSIRIVYRYSACLGRGRNACMFEYQIRLFNKRYWRLRLFVLFPSLLTFMFMFCADFCRKSKAQIPTLQD